MHRLNDRRPSQFGRRGRHQAILIINNPCRSGIVTDRFNALLEALMCLIPDAWVATDDFAGNNGLNLGVRLQAVYQAFTLDQKKSQRRQDSYCRSDSRCKPGQST